MSKESSEVQVEKSEDASAAQSKGFGAVLFEFATRVFVTASAVTLVLRPMDVYLTQLQTGMAAGPKSVGWVKASPFLFFFRAMQPYFSGLPQAVQASALKNSFMANRDHFSRAVEGPVVETKPSSAAKFQGLVLTSSLIAGLDTSATNYLNNNLTLKAMGIDPILNLREKIALSRHGFLARYSRNFAATIGCIGAASVFGSTVNPVISKKEHPVLNNIVTSSAAGFVLAPMINALEYTHRLKLKDLNLETMQARSSYAKLIKSVWQEAGLKPFMRGTFVKGVACASVFTTVNITAYLMDEFLFPKDNRHEETIAEDNHASNNLNKRI